ncbi:MAG: helix-turn-helix domain-containing protein [Rikenellaceae bacterium]
MKEKIAQLMKAEGLTTSRLAELLDIQPSAVSHLVAGRNNPRFDLIKRILKRFPNLNPDWLLLDDETMYRDSAPTTANVADRGAELSLFEEEELHVSNNAATESSQTAHNGQNVPPMPLQTPISTSAKGSPQPVRLMVLYDNGSFETYSLR